jgi:hypothetical protein
MDSKVDLERVRSLVEDLGKVVGLEAPQGPCAVLGGEAYDPAEARLSTAKAWIKARNVRSSLLSPSLFQEPAWNLLLDLYIARCENRKVRVKSAVLAMNVPATTAGRWLDRLDAEGWVRREKEAVGKRMIVVLPDDVFDRMNQVFDMVIASDRKLGLSRMYMVKSLSA